MSRTSSAKYGLVTTDMATPMVSVDCVARARAARLCRYPVRATIRMTSCSVSGETFRVLFSTCDTVVDDTPASRATSAIVVTGQPFFRLIGPRGRRGSRDALRGR